MTDWASGYRPTLSKEKAKLFARCFAFCMASSEFNFSAEETKWLADFCDAVEGKEFLTDLLAGIEEKRNELIDNAVIELAAKRRLEEEERLASSKLNSTIAAEAAKALEAAIELESD